MFVFYFFNFVILAVYVKKVYNVQYTVDSQLLKRSQLL